MSENPAEDAAIEVVRNDAKERYEITLDGKVAGFTTFEPDGSGRFAFPHTEIDPAYGGRGLGTRLVADAMTDVAERGETVVPVCPFVVRYLQQHEVPGLAIHWRERDVEVAAQADGTGERVPADEGVGDSGSDG